MTLLIRARASFSRHSRPKSYVSPLRSFLPRRTLLTLSTCDGPTEPPLLNQTVHSHLAETASKYGDRTAVISRYQQQRLTYDDLDTLSTSLARGFKKQGVKRGDRVCISLGNSIEFAVATYALFKLGAILVPLNPSFNTAQVVSALTHLDASHLVVSLETNLPRKPARSNVPLLQELMGKAVPSLQKIITVDNSHGRVDAAALRGLVRFDNMLADGKASYEPLLEKGEVLSPDDVVNIQFTSGTTSTPKAACLTHKSILNNGYSIGDRMLLTHKDIVCCPPPLFHCFGAVLGYLACTTHGSAIVFPAECFDPVATLRAVQEEQCTALHGVPTMFISELELLESGQMPYQGFDKLRTGIAAGSSVPLELMKKLHKTLNLTELTICYGMTETSPVSFMTTTDDPMEKRLDSVGRLLPHVSAKIVDPQDPSAVLPVGQKGELAISGYLVQKGYWNDPERSAEVMIPDAKGKVWMHTGDEAEMDENGYAKITGRIKDLIIRGGENIHPLEIENCLLAHPAVHEVSVVGLKDAKYGERVGAFIRTPEKGIELEEELREWVRQRLSNHLVPKHVFLSPDHFPKTASGKIQKFKLREMGEALLKSRGLAET
ncbi:acyl-CoA synthetase/AMP-acid ligase-like protein II [Sphaerosporella brunnea]|uniref:Acyl-CoA synthetase/AMP-acid ligase-like protein II n=1 Tax=Sphaerosporella brunnea TaxID=1250544 RepID=A0A5J5EQH6_9PEZI|nr:acyl-CoA synthetase/AMP-acid ligase-like protein II [Sphaerosporella brunnea]